MSVFKNTLWFKRIAIVISLIIVSLILWNTYVFFQKFKEEEKAKMKTYAIAVEELSTRGLDESAALPLKVIENTKNIPFILVKADGTKEFYNLDTIKAKNPAYIDKQLAIMKSQNAPIALKLEDLGVTEYIYYKDSDLLNRLTYYPLALILILVLFLTVVYLFFNSNKIAEQNRLWTGMAKETAHQIGTPLSSLLGWIAILRAERVDDNYVDEIEKDVYRLNTIANRFSKIGSTPELKKEELVSITKKAFDYLESRSSKQISFSFESEKEEIYTKLNTELFGWVIENLVKNAIDAMQGKGAVQLQIATNAKKITVTVSDTGKGIPKSQHKQIFKPGFTTKKRGWGLGLSLSKRIIEDYHKGRIFVQQSELGKGTTFEIQLAKV